MRLILVRHAESDAGKRGIIAGSSSCTGLTSKGLSQSRALAARLTACNTLDQCQVLLSSPILRARQTAEVLSGALNNGDPEEVTDLCELIPGDADGLTAEEAHESHGRFDMLEFPDRPFSAKGESWNSFRSRVTRCLKSLAEQYADETVIAVTHSGFIAASIIITFDIPRPGTGARLDPDHTSLTEWQVNGSVWQLVRYNDTNHLFESRR